MVKNKKLSYWKWAVGAMQIRYMFQQIDRKLDEALSKSAPERTSAEELYITQLHLRRQEIVVQAEEHEKRPRRRGTIVDGWIVDIYRWTQGIPPGMDIKLTVQDIK